VTVTPPSFSPNGDGRKDALTMTFSLTAPADVRIRIEKEGRWVASPFSGSFAAGSQTFVWNGMRSSGWLRDGDYEAVVEAVGGVGPIAVGLSFVSDTAAPRVRILPGKALRVEVSEPAMLMFVIDGQALKRDVRKAGIVRIPWTGPASRARVVAWDAAGNRSAPVVSIRRAG
jgi:flagellar hook capping protein FlgD